ncbi:MAG: hypothetical protein MR010_05025 [Lachnospiraceae bacterium]|nr:hypothetical protein [Lachnospiraceae bacterium]
MELEQKREIEYLRRDLQELDKEEADLMRQVEMIQEKKSGIMNKIAEMSDEEYEQDVFNRLYEQRKAGKILK